MLIDGLPLDAPAAPLNDLLRIGLEADPEGAALVSAERSMSWRTVGVHDEVHGENVRAYVTLREGAEQPSAADLIVHCRERIGYKAPEEILFLDEMPLNPTGKIDRTGLKRMTEDHLHPPGLETA